MYRAYRWLSYCLLWSMTLAGATWGGEAWSMEHGLGHGAAHAAVTADQPQAQDHAWTLANPPAAVAQSARFDLRPAEIGEFVAFCPVNHRAADDPIVLPGQPGMSHMHDFFGSQTTDANSTLTSLLASPSNCDPHTDRSAYWVPTLYDANDQPIAVEHATFYYTVRIDDYAHLQAFPQGLKIVAGSARATTAPAPSHFKWSCLGSPVSSTSAFVSCPVDSKLELLLNFPDCWNGQDLDSPDHQSHMAYSANQVCPSSHPVGVPELQFKLRYSTPGSPNMRLASGAGFTAHGDFFNAWEPQALDNRVECLRRLLKCGPGGFGIAYLPVVQR